MKIYRFFMTLFIVQSIYCSICSIYATMIGHPTTGLWCAGFSIVSLWLSITVQPQPVLKPWTYEDLLGLRLPPLESEDK